MKLIAEMTEQIGEKTEGEIDYISIVNADTLQDLEKLKGKVLVAMAVQFGKARLIDNIRLKV